MKEVCLHYSYLSVNLCVPSLSDFMEVSLSFPEYSFPSIALGIFVHKVKDYVRWSQLSHRIFPQGNVHLQTNH